MNKKKGCVIFGHFCSVKKGTIFDYIARIIMWLLLLTCVQIIEGFSVLDLHHLDIILQPLKCENNQTLVSLIHSAPKNVELRNAVRETWGKDIKHVFVLGQDDQWNKQLKKEHEEHGDILQVNFTDAYRNMTYKHLIGYW